MDYVLDVHLNDGKRTTYPLDLLDIDADNINDDMTLKLIPSNVPNHETVVKCSIVRKLNKYSLVYEMCQGMMLKCGTRHIPSDSINIQVSYRIIKLLYQYTDASNSDYEKFTFFVNRGVCPKCSNSFRIDCIDECYQNETIDCNLIQMDDEHFKVSTGDWISLDTFDEKTFKDMVHAAFPTLFPELDYCIDGPQYQQAIKEMVISPL